MEILAKITMDNGEFFVENIDDGVKHGPLKFCDAEDKTIVLVKNNANRWWANRKKVTEACEKEGFYGLEFKESKKIGPVSRKIPNEKLIAYMPEDVQTEYLAIIERATKRMEDEKAKPLTELEKAQAAARRANEKYEKLLAQAAGTTEE